MLLCEQCYQTTIRGIPNVARRFLVIVLILCSGLFSNSLRAQPLVLSGDGTLALVGNSRNWAVVAEEGVPPAKNEAELVGSPWVRILAISKDKSTFATVANITVSRFRVEIVSRIPHAKVLATLARDEEPLSLAVAPDGSSAAIGTDTQVLLLSSKTGRASPIVQTPKKATALAYSSDGTGLAVGDSEGNVRLVSLKSRKALWEERPHEGEVRGLAFSADGKSLASCSEDETIRVTQAGTGQRIRHIHAHRRTVTAVAISQDGSLVGSVGLDRCVTVWDVKKGEQLFYQPLLLLDTRASLAFTKDSKFVIASGQFRGVLEARTGKTVYSNGKLGKPKDSKDVKPK